MIYWFYGQPGSGKTTIAKLLKEHVSRDWEGEKERLEKNLILFK